MEVTVTAKTLDEAITEALLELRTTSEFLDYKVIEEGKEGLLGVIGSKPWVIRAKALTEEELKEKERRKLEPEPVKEEAKEEPKEEAKPEPKADTVKEKENIIIPEEKSEDTECEPEISEEQKPESKREIKPVSEEKAAELTEKALTFLNDIFKVMGMTVETETTFDHNENELGILLSGDDMGVLIGKRGQTLDSLQYLASLVVNRHQDGYIRVKLDTENYRERRQVKLEELAHNIARKVAKSKRSVALEPMNPYERRIIHSALQSDPYVTTLSEGEEPYRHVVVMMKKGSNKKNRK